MLICVNGDEIDAPLLEASPGLRLVALASTGYDSVDVASADRLGHRGHELAGHAPRDHRRPHVRADHCGPAAHERGGALPAGRVEWRQDDLDLLLGLDVYGTTLGIVGYGQIGQAVARRARGFGMTVIHNRRTRGDDEWSRWVPFDELLATSDIVSLHVPSTPETRNLIGERELRLMKPTATLVNAARGAVLDEVALARALREGWIGSAGLDVQQVEPNSDPGYALFAVPNCVVLPHIGSATRAAREAMVDMATRNVIAFIEGRPLITPVGRITIAATHEGTR